MEIDRSIDRLVKAFRDAGLPSIGPATADIEDQLAEVDRAIAPLQLPAELRAFWRRIDPRSLVVSPYPAPTTVGFALGAWQDHKDSVVKNPSIMFPACYSSHVFMLVELHDARRLGGSCFDWAYAGSPYTLEFVSLTAYVDLFAAFIEAGEFKVHDEGARPWYEFDPEGRWDSAQQARLANDLPHPRYGRHQVFDEDVRRWPEHWLAADGISAEDWIPRGATTTIAELVARASSGASATGTVHARVTRCAGSGAGIRAQVDDGSGSLELWCPADVCNYGPSMRQRNEFDVVVRPTLEPGDADAWRKQREVQEHALAHDLERAQASAAELYAELFETPTAAEALAIRPLD